MHTPFAVVTENTLFAMPEVKIGLSPDAGVDRLLAGLDRYCGIYIGMTGIRLSAADMLELGLVQHDIAAKAISTLLEQLVTLENITPECLECLPKNMPHAKSPPSQFTPEILDWIAEAFCSDSTAKIISQVSDDAKKSNSIANFAKTADESMQAGSPISLCLTHRLLRLEPQKLEATLQRNFIIGQNCFQHGDFYEGVRALLIDKDNAPNWRYESLSEIENQIYDKFLTPILPLLELDITVS